MKRLLIVITRMYARQGYDLDEFVDIWQGAAYMEHRIFSRRTSSNDDHVLVIHGYEYPQRVEFATSRAVAQVETGIRSTDLRNELRERRTGVMFHPRQSWTPVAQMQIGQGIKIWLRRAGAAVDYIEAYHHGSIIDRKLARACLERQDFSKVLDELWTIFLKSAVARYERQLDSLTKELEAILLPLCKEESNTGRLSDIEQSARGILTRARQLVLDDREESESVVTLTWEVAEKVNERKKEKLISALADLEKLFSQSDRRYQQVDSLLQSSEHDPEVSASEEALPATSLDALRSKRGESDPLNMWCQAVFNALSDLRQALNE
jgi:hypothetical protein